VGSGSQTLVCPMQDCHLNQFKLVNLYESLIYMLFYVIFIYLHAFFEVTSNTVLR